jgi:hypothetical protein
MHPCMHPCTHAGGSATRSTGVPTAAFGDCGRQNDDGWFGRQLGAHGRSRPHQFRVQWRGVRRSLGNSRMVLPNIHRGPTCTSCLAQPATSQRGNSILAHFPSHLVLSLLCALKVRLACTGRNSVLHSLILIRPHLSQPCLHCKLTQQKWW